jgi:hypothetical protein
MSNGGVRNYTKGDDFGLIEGAISAFSWKD